MSGTAFAVDWLRTGGMAAGTWAVLAVLVKIAADRSDPGPAARPPAEPTPGSAAAAPPRPSFPPSTARHAGPPALDEARLLTAASVSLTKRPTWT
ncbi:hypothetical protein SEA_KROMP_42 [Streptomyces phage Kromp]|uniref:Uncharacterized protein n=1 Tax=Streptomyces phage Kromp TaxID=2315619 RepID=A0A386K8U5_9CAUD|nr:hypothetical protein SEA_KROMP_42 [Streptomyces phage Kromp]